MSRSISISLAAKCQLLFGLAVLVIIAGALAVPWQRMEQLAGQQNVKAARMLADATFRQIHMRVPTTGPSTVASSEPGGAGTQPATRGAGRWNDVSLVDIPDYPPPRIIMLGSPTDELATADALTRQAVEVFRAHPKEPEEGKVFTVPQDREKIRVYKYAAAIRLERSCLGCHGQWESWVAPRAATTATRPATTAVATTKPLQLTPTTARGEASMPSAPLAAPVTWPLVAVVRVDLPWQIDDNQILLNRIVIVVAGIVGGSLAIAVFYLITSRLILQPVRVLKNTAEKVAKGDLNIRSAISTGDEFQQLSETFNTMLTTLKTSQDQLESTNRSLDTRVGELAQSNVDLYEANRLKSEFLTNVSHELRTPLNAIIGFTDLLADNPLTREAKLARYVDNIKTSARQLLDMINDLLDLAKIEAGKLILREEKLNVSDICEAMLNFMKPLAAKKNIELSVECAQQMPLITTDPGRFQQILYNFLSNAIKFTPPEGKVAIKAGVERASGPGGEEAPPPGAEGAGGRSVDTARAVRVSVTDTGPGIPLEHQQTVFEKFRQLDASHTRQHAGSGLGLAISRELASMLGGHIELVSAAGQGSTFSLIVPITLQKRTVEVHG